MIRAFLFLILLSVSTSTQAFYGASGGSSGGEDVITATGRKGHIASIYNLFDGRSHSIQVSRLAPNGAVHWSQQHYDGNYEKAYAAAIDSKGNIFIAGVRRYSGGKFFLLLKFDENGYLETEIVDDQYDCTAINIAVDPEDNVAIAGVCRYGQNFPARLLRYSNDGGLLWFDEYDGGGRNYVRGMNLDYAGNVAMTVETVFGDYRDGSFVTRTVVYDKQGRRIDVR